MINILPPAIKSSLRYAHRNVGLRHWLVVFSVSLIGLGAIGTFGLLTLHQSTANYERQAEAAQNQLNKEHIGTTKKQVEDISARLKLAVQVLSKEVLFSKLITQIGAAMPRGTVLTGLTINQTTGAIDLQAAATNYTAATQVQVNMSDPANQIFAKADLVSINCAPQTAANAAYPCQVVLRALFGNNNQFLFINKGAKS